MSQVADAHPTHWAASLDSMEGVPEWPQPVESPAERAARGRLAERGHEVFGWLGTILPGAGLALGLAAAGR
jgi:hypothetical protein